MKFHARRLRVQLTQLTVVLVGADDNCGIVTMVAKSPFVESFHSWVLSISGCLRKPSFETFVFRILEELLVTWQRSQYAVGRCICRRGGEGITCRESGLAFTKEAREVGRADRLAQVIFGLEH